MESPTSVRVERRFELVENRSRDMLRNVPRRAHLDKLDAARDERVKLKSSRRPSEGWGPCLSINGAARGARHELQAALERQKGLSGQPQSFIVPIRRIPRLCRG